MNQILMTWNPGPANEDTWDPISAQTLSWCPWWQASSMLRVSSPEGDEEEIERAETGDATPRTFRGQSFSGGPSSSMRTT